VDAVDGAHVHAGTVFDVDAGLSDDVRHWGGLLYWRRQLLDELSRPFLERALDDHLIEACGMRAAQSGCVGVPTEAEDGDVGVSVRNLVGVDARDVRDHEIRPVGAVSGDQVMVGE
jgi:hypothetical protein